MSAPEEEEEPQKNSNFSGSQRLSDFQTFLAALQPYKSACPRWGWVKCKNIFQIFSLVMKTKLVQNVNRMSERQNDMPKDRRTDRQTDRQTERQIEDKTTFQLSYQNKSCSECQQDVRKIERQAERQTDRRTDRQTDRIFSLVIKTKVVQNVNRMSKSQSDRWEDIQCARQTE